MKTCSNCKIEKQSEEFSKDKKGTQGLCGWCKLCTKEYKQHYYSNQESVTTKKCHRCDAPKDIKSPTCFVCNHKFCKSCQTFKPLPDFSPLTKATDGLAYKCKICANAAATIWKNNNRERYRERQHAHYVANKTRIQERYKKRYIEHKDEIAAYHINFYSDISNKAKNLVSRTKRYSKEKGLPFDIDADYLVQLYNGQQGKCAITKMPLNLTRGYGRQPDSLSLDRKLPVDGYTKGNVRFICDAINVMKSDMTDEQMYKWAARVVDGLKKSTNVVVPNLNSFADSIDRLTVELLKLSAFESAKRDEQAKVDADAETIKKWDNLSRDCCEYRSLLKNHINQQLAAIVQTGSYLPLRELRTFRAPSRSVEDIIEDMINNTINSNNKLDLVNRLAEDLSFIEKGA